MRGLVLLLAGCAAAPAIPSREWTGEAAAGLIKGRSALVLRSYPDGAPVDLGAPSGEATVVELWATWCPACREAAPVVAALAERVRGRPVRVLTVNVDEDEGALRKFLSRRPFGLPVLRETGPALPAELLPTFIVLGPRGEVRSVKAGFDTLAELSAYQQREIDGALGH